MPGAGHAGDRQHATDLARSPDERKLAEMGEHQRLRDTRMYFQHATETEFRETIERILGRRVRAFVSGMDTRSDVASEVFYLENAE